MQLAVRLRCQSNETAGTLSREGDECVEDGELLRLRCGEPGRQLRCGLRRIGR